MELARGVLLDYKQTRRRVSLLSEGLRRPAGGALATIGFQLFDDVLGRSRLAGSRRHGFIENIA